MSKKRNSFGSVKYRELMISSLISSYACETTMISDLGSSIKDLGDRRNVGQYACPWRTAGGPRLLLSGPYFSTLKMTPLVAVLPLYRLRYHVNVNFTVDAIPMRNTALRI